MTPESVELEAPMTTPSADIAHVEMRRLGVKSVMDVRRGKLLLFAGGDSLLIPTTFALGFPSDGDFHAALVERVADHVGKPSTDLCWRCTRVLAAEQQMSCVRCSATVLVVGEGE